MGYIVLFLLKCRINERFTPIIPLSVLRYSYEFQINRLESLGQESIFLAQSRHDTEGFCRAGSSAGLEFLGGNPNMKRQFHLNMSGMEILR